MSQSAHGTRGGCNRERARYAYGWFCAPARAEQRRVLCVNRTSADTGMVTHAIEQCSGRWRPKVMPVVSGRCNRSVGKLSNNAWGSHSLRRRACSWGMSIDRCP